MLNSEYPQIITDEWITENGGYRDKFQILTRLSEELDSALQHYEWLRPKKVDADFKKIYSSLWQY